MGPPPCRRPWPLSRFRPGACVIQALSQPGGSPVSPVLPVLRPQTPHTLPEAEESTRSEGSQLGSHSAPVGAAQPTGAQRGDTASPSFLPKTEESGMRGGGQRQRQRKTEAETERRETETERQTQKQTKRERGSDRGKGRDGGKGGRGRSLTETGLGWELGSGDFGRDAAVCWASAYPPAPPRRSAPLGQPLLSAILSFAPPPYAALALTQRFSSNDLTFSFFHA